jgi:hypothetical protein
VKIIFSNPVIGIYDVLFSVPEIEDRRSRADLFEEVSVVFPASVNLTGAKQPERLQLLGVSPNYFAAQGLPSSRGINIWRIAAE